MKRTHIFITASIVLFMGCKKMEDFGDTNVNPNATSTPSPAALLTNAQTGMGATNLQGGLYAQQISETQYTEVSLYALPKLNFDGIYVGVLMDLQNVISLNTNEATKIAAAKFGANQNQIAIARILKAYVLWTITDRWGDVPYSQAFNGLEDLTPAYDKQEDIYKDLIKELTEAKDQLNSTLAAVVGDVIYYKPTTATIAWATAVGKWKKLANSLRMLIALRTSKVYPNAGGWAATNFSAAYNDAAGYIATNADNFMINYTGSVAAFRNPWFQVYNGRTDYAESKLMTDLMATLSDPRQASFGSSNVGFPYGLTRDLAVAFGSANAGYARVLASSKRATNSPMVLIGASHVRLAIAEVAQRGWITADIAANYQAGIQASWDQWGVTGDIAVYMGNTNVALTGAASDLQKIQLQQYIAFYPDGSQAWFNWRRTNVPQLVPTQYATNSSKQIPRRFTYGANEYSVNLESVNEAISRLTGGDSQDARVWWDK